MKGMGGGIGFFFLSIYFFKKWIKKLEFYPSGFYPFFINLRFLSILSYPFFENRENYPSAFIHLMVFIDGYIFFNLIWKWCKKSQWSHRKINEYEPQRRNLMRELRRQVVFLAIGYLLKPFFNLSEDHFWVSNI